MNNRYPQTPSMIPPPGIPRYYPFGPTPMLTPSPLYSSGVGFVPNMSASPFPPIAFTSGNYSNSSFSAASSLYFLPPNNLYPVSGYPGNNLYPASSSSTAASYNSPYPESALPSPLYSSGVRYVPNVCALPYPSIASTSGNHSNYSFSASSSPYLLAPNNLHPVSGYPGNNLYPASPSSNPASSSSPYPEYASPYLAYSNKCYPASGSPYLACSNSRYPISNYSPHLAPVSAYSCSRHYLPDVSLYRDGPPPLYKPQSIFLLLAMGRRSRGDDYMFEPSVNETDDNALNINDLPNEIIVKVFSYLRQNQLGWIARVCRRWNALAKSPFLWKKVHVKFSPTHGCQTTIAKSFINGLPSCVTYIRIDFWECDKWNELLDFEELSRRMQEKCPHLETLIFLDAVFSGSLSSIIDFCSQFLQNVNKLIFLHSKFLCDRSTDEWSGVSKIEILELFECDFKNSSKPPFSKMPHLKHLHLRGPNVKESWLEGDTSFLNQLHMLNLGVRDITLRMFRTIQNHCHNLKELYLCSTHLQDNHLTFTDSVFPHLKTVCLGNCDVTCEGVVSLIASCSSLENVYVDERVARRYVEHPFVLANKCKSGIVKNIYAVHEHNGDYSYCI